MRIVEKENQNMKRGVTSDGGYLNVPQQPYNPGAASFSNISPLASPFLSTGSFTRLTPNLGQGSTPSNVSGLAVGNNLQEREAVAPLVAAAPVQSQVVPQNQTKVGYNVEWTTPSSSTLTLGFSPYLEQHSTTTPNLAQGDVNPQKVSSKPPLPGVQTQTMSQAGSTTPNMKTIQEQLLQEQALNNQLQQQKMFLQMQQQQPAQQLAPNTIYVQQANVPIASTTIPESQAKPVSASARSSTKKRKGMSNTAPKFSNVTSEEELKRLKRLETNRKSAQQSRKRKKEKINGLEMRAKNLEDENVALKAENEKLKASVTELKKRIEELERKTSDSTVPVPEASPLFSSPISSPLLRLVSPSVKTEKRISNEPLSPVVGLNDVSANRNDSVGVDLKKTSGYTESETKAKELLAKRDVSMSLVNSLQQLMDTPLSSTFSEKKT